MLRRLQHDNVRKRAAVKMSYMSATEVEEQPSSADCGCACTITICSLDGKTYFDVWRYSCGGHRTSPNNLHQGASQGVSTAHELPIDCRRYVDVWNVSLRIAPGRTEKCRSANVDTVPVWNMH